MTKKLAEAPRYQTLFLHRCLGGGRNEFTHLKMKYMYYLKSLLVGLSLLSFTTRPVYLVNGKDNSEKQKGLFLSKDDFLQHKLSYAGNCAAGNTKIKLYELFGSSDVVLVLDGKKQTFSKDKVYGYRDCEEMDYRFFKKGAYRILDTTGFYLYSINKLVQGEKIARPQTVYYFSVDGNSPLETLTLENVKKVFAGNASFRYTLDAQFRSDKDLIAYDEQMKTYKIKYLYNQSTK
jgi:hypothetical protein